MQILKLAYIYISLFLNFFKKYFMSMRVLCLHMCLCPTCVPAAHGSEKGVGRPDTVVTGSCELLCVC